MVESMTGFGKGEASNKGITFSVELRSVNNRFLEISTRIPRSLTQRESEIRDIVKAKIARGKISINATRNDEGNGELAISVDKKKAKAVTQLLQQLQKTVKSKESIKLEHLLQFSEIFETKESGEGNDQEWKVFSSALKKAVESLKTMRMKEGSELAKDLRSRVTDINTKLDTIESISKKRIPEERTKLQERIGQLVSDKSVVDNQRLELEIAILSDKLDVTEECVRFRSHNKFFIEALNAKESEGRKLNFMIQEMNREANTIGSKCNDVDVAHIVVSIKEELEKIREQLQNIE